MTRIHTDRCSVLLSIESIACVDDHGWQVRVVCEWILKSCRLRCTRSFPRRELEILLIELCDLQSKSFSENLNNLVLWLELCRVCQTETCDVMCFVASWIRFVFSTMTCNQKFVLKEKYRRRLKAQIQIWKDTQVLNGEVAVWFCDEAEEVLLSGFMNGKQDSNPGGVQCQDDGLFGLREILCFPLDKLNVAFRVTRKNVDELLLYIASNKQTFCVLDMNVLVGEGLALGATHPG